MHLSFSKGNDFERRVEIYFCEMKDARSERLSCTPPLLPPSLCIKNAFKAKNSKVRYKLLFKRERVAFT